MRQCFPKTPPSYSSSISYIPQLQTASACQSLHRSLNQKHQPYRTRIRRQIPVSITYVALPSFAVNPAVPSPPTLHTSTASPNVVALERSAHERDKGVGVHDGAVALVRGGTLLSVEPQNSREAEADWDAPARYQALVMNRAGRWRRGRRMCHRMFLGRDEIRGLCRMRMRNAC